MSVSGLFLASREKNLLESGERLIVLPTVAEEKSLEPQHVDGDRGATRAETEVLARIFERLAGVVEMAQPSQGIPVIGLGDGTEVVDPACGIEVGIKRFGHLARQGG